MLSRTPSWPARMLRPALGDAPQHGVDELGEAMRAAVAPRRLDGEIDDRVRGHVETDELGGAGEQDRPQAALVGRQRPLEEALEHELELALPAQRGRCHRPRQRPVAGLQRGMLGPRRLLRQHMLQRPLVHEHAGDEVHGKLACREPGVAGPDARFLLPSSHAQCSPSGPTDPVRVCFCSKDGCTATRRSSVGILLTPHPTRATLPTLGHRISVRPRKTSGSK